ncbi:hypothetical protein V7119_08380, partial [Bacillus toyonensis]
MDEAAESAPVLENSAREILKGTLVPMHVPAARDEPGGGIVKLGAIRQLALTRGDTDDVRDRLGNIEQRHGDTAHVSNETLELLKAFEDPLVPSLRPDLTTISRIPARELAAFAEVHIEKRTEHMRGVEAADSPTE